MKIDALHSICTPQETSQAANNRNAGSREFSEMLAQAQAAEQGQVQAQQVSTKTSAAAESDAAAATPALPEMWHQLGGLLESLDSYGQALGNPNLTLKQVEPYVADLEAKAQGLEAGLSGQDDPELAEIGLSAVAQAKVEAFKFRRGDYV